jgi:hypothetical protein
MYRSFSFGGFTLAPRRFMHHLAAIVLIATLMLAFLTSFSQLQHQQYAGALTSTNPLSLTRLNYDTGDLSQWKCKEDLPPTNTLKVVTGPSQPVIQGSHSLKTTLRADAKIVPGTNGERAEVKYCDSPGHAHLFKNGDDLWFSWYSGFSYFNFTTPGTQPKWWHVWTQWHGLDGTTVYGLPITFNLNGNILNLRVNTIKYDQQNPNCTSQIIVSGQPNTSCGYLWAKTLQVGHWYKILLHVRWSTSSNGLVEGNVDGVPIKIFHGNILAPSGSADTTAYLKQGLYRNKDINLRQEVYHDGTLIAKCPLNAKFNPDTIKCISP